MYKIRGRITSIRTENIKSKKGDEFEKMLINIVETDTGFDHTHQFEIFGKESIEVHKHNIKEDRYVNINFYVKSREWKDKFFNTLCIKDILIEDELITPKENGEMPF